MTYTTKCCYKDLVIGQVWIDESPINEIEDDLWVDEKLIISNLPHKRYNYNHGLVEVTRLDGTKKVEYCCVLFSEKTLTKIAN